MTSGEGLAVKTACRALDVTSAGFCDWLTRPLSPRVIRRAWLSDVVTDVHATSRGTYGAPRVHAELRLGRGIIVGHNQVARIMRDLGLAGLPLRKRFRRPGEIVTVLDLVERQFLRDEPDRLWVTDITEHRTERASCTAPWCSTPSPAGSWAAPSTPLPLQPW